MHSLTSYKMAKSEWVSANFWYFFIKREGSEVFHPDGISVLKAKELFWRKLTFHSLLIFILVNTGSFYILFEYAS